VLPEGPEHLAWPFRMSGRRLATVEQDSIEDVRQNVHSYLATERGERPLAPDFGLEDPTFGPGVSPERLAAEIDAAEGGRARVEVTVFQPDGAGRASVNVSVDLAD
jgi:hypothetical protein